MTSRDAVVECQSSKYGCAPELPLFDGHNCSDRLRNAVNHHAQGSTESQGFGIVDPAARRSSTNSSFSSCTPHSIEDILGRPQRGHVTSLILPETRRWTSGPAAAAAGRLCSSWSAARSSDEVQRLSRRLGDDALTWKSLQCWSQQSTAGPQDRLIAAMSPTKAGTVVSVTGRPEGRTPPRPLKKLQPVVPVL